jgi:hypothetical protein
VEIPIIDIVSNEDADEKSEDGGFDNDDCDEDFDEIKVAIVLGTRYVENYKSIQTKQSGFAIANPEFRDSARIEMLAEMLGENSIVRSMNCIEGSNEFHISAFFGKRAARNIEFSELKVQILI